MARSPLGWYGGKYFISKDLVRLFPAHNRYVEVFGGAGHVLFEKRRSEEEIYNDLHDGLVDFWRLIKDDEKREKLIEKLNLTPYSREECRKSRDWREEDNPVERVRLFFTNINQSRNAKEKGSWSYSIASNSATKGWYEKINKYLPSCIDVIKNVKIENLDFRDCIKKYDSKNTFMYLDPPYISDTRVAKNAYDREMKVEDHGDMVELLIRANGKYILSGYDSKIYNRLVGSGWRKLKLGDYTKHSSPEVGEKGEEYIWLNYSWL